MAALTFDDGPDSEGTPAVLEALDAAQARATFFLVGDELRRSIALGREILAGGHEVALHCYSHERHDRLSPTQARDDVAKGLGALEVATGRRPRWYRPPYGLFSEGSYAACERLGLERAYWSAWGLDWEATAPARVAELVMRDLDDGTIVLLHDSPRFAARDDVSATVEAIPLIAAAAKERGLALVTLSEAVGEAGPST